MERNFYTDEFELLIKEKADQFRMYPSKRVWHSIYNNLHPSRKWPSFAIFILFLTSLLSIGYLNTSDNSSRNAKLAGNGASSTTLSDNSIAKTDKLSSADKTSSKTNIDNLNYSDYSVNTPQAGSKAITVNDQPGGGGTEYAGSISKSKKHNNPVTEKNKTRNPGQAIADQKNGRPLLIDVASASKKNKLKGTKPDGKRTNPSELAGENEEALNTADPKTSISFNAPAVSQALAAEMGKQAYAENKKAPIINAGTKPDPQEEKAWIENYAMLNKPSRSKWKGRLDLELYATPAVNYRKLTTESKGSAAPFATTGDINKSISQKPGLGIETGVGISYAFAKNMRLKAGVQFNYTNYNINADQMGHPIQTTILLTDPVTGLTYPAARVSDFANNYDNAQQPVTLHNRTYQVSLPIGLSYKLSSNKNVEWFIGATAQPSYIFGGKAHLISSDLKNYISDPSTIRNWNLNIGIETYMNYRLGSYSFRVGPQVRYQVYSTYRKNVALIEKPYAVGLKFGIVKGF